MISAKRLLQPRSVHYLTLMRLGLSFPQTGAMKCADLLRKADRAFNLFSPWQLSAVATWLHRLQVASDALIGTD